MKNYAIDTHCHIHFEKKEEWPKLIQRAEQAGVHKMISVCCNVEQIIDLKALTESNDSIWCSSGIHPTDLAGDFEEIIMEVEKFAQHEKVVAIGEAGLDYYHDKFDHALQEKFFKAQIQIAKKLNKPVIIHCRAGKGIEENQKAFDDLIRILKEEDFSNAVMHCFSGNWAQAQVFLKQGLKLSFTGILTYPKNTALQEVVEKMELKDMMIETDSPFLTPQAYRGKKNEPAYVIEVAKKISEIRGISYNETLEITSKNAEEFFGV